MISTGLSKKKERRKIGDKRKMGEKRKKKKR